MGFFILRPHLWLWILVIVAVVGGSFVFWESSTASRSRGAAAYRHTEKILDFGPRPAGSEALDQVRGYLSAELKASGWVTQEQVFERSTPVGKVIFKNLRARYAPDHSDPWNRTVESLLCVHVDSKYDPQHQFLGADDSASGCGAILEIAAYLADQSPELAQQIELVFFDGEEAFEQNITPTDGLYGSRHYANLWRSEPHKPRFGILLDMVGHRNLSIKIPSDTPEFLKRAALRAAKDEGASPNFGVAASPIIDDHVPLNFAGIPTVDLIGDFSRFPWWHTPGDQLSIISSESLDISIRVTLRMLDALMTESD